MVINPGDYKDDLSKTSYTLPYPINFHEKRITLIKGSNGVGKTRFVEGILLKELRKEKKSIVYFGQDLENQILTYELISLVKDFIDKLKKNGNFLKAVLFNDNSHKEIDIEFNSKEILNPSIGYIRKFIEKESIKHNPDIIIYDEADKYFPTEDDFHIMLNKVKCKNIVIISHLIDNGDKIIKLVKDGNTVNVQ